MAVGEQVEMLARAGHLPSRFILEWGMHGAATPLPEGIPRGPMGACYANAGRVARDFPGLVYCEGLAQRADLPIATEHAWLLDPATGLFVDPTWKELGGEYLGVPFRQEYLLDTTIRTKRWGLLVWPTVPPLPEDPDEFLWRRP